MSNSKLQLIQVSTPEQVQNAILIGFRKEIEELKLHFEPKTPTEYLTRQKVAEMLSIDLSTVHNWKKKGILKAYAIGGRVFYKRKDIENALVELKN